VPLSCDEQQKGWYNKNNKRDKVMFTTNTFVANDRQPEAYITKNRSRLRQLNSNVYLNDNDEFEIELYNPKTISVLAKIKINGTHISNNGIVIKPGQRFFLDRYIDVANKFLFSTYDVESDNPEVLAAIEQNGLVEIEFYDQYVRPVHLGGYTNNPMWINGSNMQPYYGAINYINNTTANNTNFSNPTFTTNSLSGPSGPNGLSAPDGIMGLSNIKSIETGRIEKGGKSDTKFKNVDIDFNYWIGHKITWKILPTSQKPITPGDIRNYCGECGHRIRKSNWKFCPMCGEEIK